MRSKRSRSTNRMILWSYPLLIDFFNSNLKPDFNSSKLIKSCLDYIKKFECDLKKSNLYQNSFKLIEIVKIYRLIRYTLTFFILKSIMFDQILIKRSKLDQKWSTLIKNRSNLYWNRNRRLEIVIGIGFIL